MRRPRLYVESRLYGARQSADAACCRWPDLFSISVGFGITSTTPRMCGQRMMPRWSGLTAVCHQRGVRGWLRWSDHADGLLRLPRTDRHNRCSEHRHVHGLGFQTLPVVFAQMGAIGPLVGAVCVVMLFLAAVTSWRLHVSACARLLTREPRPAPGAWHLVRRGRPPRRRRSW